jgi:hypothetical protein
MNRFSSGFEKSVNAHKGVKEIFNDFVIKYYDGTPPTTADAAATGNLLATFTKGGATLTGTNSTRQEANITVVRGNTNDTCTLTFSTPAKELIYTQTAADTNSDQLATTLATAINADTTINKVVEAIAIIGAGVTEAVCYIRALYPGEPFVLDSSVGSGAITLTQNAITANSRINSLHFDSPNSDGDLVNEAAYTWLATGLVEGSATYFRIVKCDDTAALSTTQERIQGNISTAGAEINLQPSTQIVVGQPLSITLYTLSVNLAVA